MITRTYTITDPCGEFSTLVHTIYVDDTQGPTVTLLGSATMNICVGSVFTDPGATASDVCSGDVTGSIMVTGGPVTTGAPGMFILTYTATDGCGNMSSTMRTVNVSAPTVTLNDPADVCVSGGVDMNFTGTPANGVFTTTASAGLTDNGDGTAVLDVSAACAGTYDVTYTYTDMMGCSASQTVSVTILPCGVDVAGKLIWERNRLTTMDGVANATVTLSGDGSDTDNSTAAGLYAVSSATGTNFAVKPLKNRSVALGALLGVTSADASRIQQHVGGGFPLTDPYKLIAADVNNSKAVTAQDASLISQALLGNPVAQLLFVNRTWVFVPEAHVFPNPLNPWQGGPPYFPEDITLSSVSCALIDQDFIGSKLGDVNGTTNPATLLPTQSPDLIWNVQDQAMQQDAIVVAEFRAEGFTNLLAYQFAMSFDPEKLELLDIEIIPGSPMQAGNFGTYNLAEGEIRAVLAMEQGLTLPIGTPVFRLKFKVIEGGDKLSDVLTLNDNILKGEAYLDNYTAGSVSLVYDGVVTGTNDPAKGKLRLLQNRPNPFKGNTTIGFVLPEDCEAQMRVFDVSGRLIEEQKSWFPAGYNEMEFRLGGYPGSGILYYELTTPYGTLSKKMILVRE
ncbi:MAG: hypothetical protein EPGJADBJ_02699 [Saprospiraceae bacterium]|nr:hypothetical protein [Saprospiraceae bacterium]